MKKIIILILIVGFSMSLLAAGEKAILKKYKLSAKVDSVRGYTTYMPKRAADRHRIFVYIVKRHMDDSYILRLRIAYYAPEMLHLKRYVFYIDDKEHEILVRDTVRMQTMERLQLPGNYYDQQGGGICEYYDIAMNSGETEIMKKVAASKGVKLKYEGTKGFKKIKIHKGEAKVIKRGFDAFEAFNSQQGKQK
jgi:hypothetical protein